jgi:thiol-disulfide isomerase/thioredoxin
MRVLLTLLLITLFATVKSQTFDSTWLANHNSRNGFYVSDTGRYLPKAVFVDEKGNKKTLADYIGKIVYVDIWATWCGNCIIKFPYAEQLRRRLHVMNLDTSVVFVNINIDDTKSKWKKALNKYHPGGINLYSSDTALYTKWNIESLPAYNLLDRQGSVLGIDIYEPDEPMAIDWILYNAAKGVHPSEALRIKHEQDTLVEQHRTASAITDEGYAKWYKAIVPAMMEYEKWRQKHVGNESR